MKSVFQLVRLPAGFSALSNVLAAHVLVTGGNTLGLELVLSLLASLCLYFGGMGLNDCFDFQDDRRERSNRPLPSGDMALGQAWFISCGLILVGVLLAAVIGRDSLIIAIILALCIVLYDSKVLEPIPSDLKMAACRYLNWLLAMSVVGFSGINFAYPLALFFYVSGLTLLSKAEARIESKLPLYQSIVFFFFSAMVLFYQSISVDAPLTVPVFALALFVGFLLRVLLPLSQEFTPASVQAAIGKLVMGVIIVDATLLTILGYPLVAMCILLLLIPGKYLGRWLYVS